MIEAILAGLFGLLIGSFLNVCIYRLPRDLSVVHPRSHCTSCEKLVAWYDNVPVLSYMILRGKCRYCREPYSIQYPIVEFVTGMLFFFSVLKAGANAEGGKLCALCAVMVDLVVTDLNDRILPDEFTYGGFLAALVMAPVTAPASSLSMVFLPLDQPRWVHSLAEAAIGGLFPAGLLWLTGEVYYRVRKREGLGLGDVKMMLAVGGFLGLPGALITIFVGSVLGGVIGGLYILFTREDSAYELPFGSFLGAAALLCGLVGDKFFAWYSRLLA